jgi:hypothetical protein
MKTALKAETPHVGKTTQLQIKMELKSPHLTSFAGRDEQNKNLFPFAIRFNVTVEIAFVSRRSKIEHEMAQKQKIPKVARLERTRKSQRQNSFQNATFQEHANNTR